MAKQQRRPQAQKPRIKGREAFYARESGADRHPRYPAYNRADWRNAAQRGDFVEV